ncbi:hypothetical protein [Mesoplasma melaleucae]|uniref:Uncharacterized protein n=1 Tax=Mesoplasma melaleucae TaxID=81459 RepID=A0A2K8NZ83_9MOLU|nr:hypothetical protein [Mesoplasma melaleucae]ATZ18041.1 hypothetical protein EMELA_v1c05010 [Mesoplasma melaleucae]
MKIIIFPLIISIILLAYSIYIFVKDLKSYSQIKKLIKQDSKYFKNKKLFIILIIYLITVLVMSVIYIAITIVYMVIINDALILTQSIISIIYMILLLVWLTLIQKVIKSIFVVVKNNKIVIWDQVISFTDIEVIKNDVNRRRIIFKVKEAESYNFIKILYHWELKDFLNELKLNTEFI